MLIKEGFSPVCTDAPESVLQIARTVMPTAILIDIQMPGLNGWDVLDTLRSDPVTTSIPVFMLSIYEERHKARENGASGLISKPLDINKLKSAMRAAQEQDAGPASTHATG
jgi:CheY-like chemotaxis protein